MMDYVAELSPSTTFLTCLLSHLSSFLWCPIIQSIF